MRNRAIYLNCRDCYEDVEVKLFVCAEPLEDDDYHVRVVVQACCPQCDNLLSKDEEVLCLQ